MTMERDEAIELAVKSLDAIDKITNHANFYIGALTLLLGLAAIFGWAILQTSAMAKAEGTATDRIDRFLKTDEGREFVRKAVAEEVKSQLESKTFGGVKPLFDDVQDEPFPVSPEEGQQP